MNSIRTKLVLTIAGALAFNLLFWQEKLALNFLIFDVFIIASVLALFPAATSRVGVRWILPAHLLCLAIVMIYNTDLSKLAAGITLILFVAFAEHLHRSLFYAAGTMMYQAGFLLPEVRKLLKEASTKQVKSRRPVKNYRFLLFPFALVFLFLVVYVAGNRAFGSLVADAIEQIVIRMETIFGYISIDRLIFLLLGAYITGSMLFTNRGSKFSDEELALSDRLIRARKRKSDDDFSIFNEFIVAITGRFSKGMLALKNRNLVGLISIVLLNGLLLMINITDIAYIWFGENYGNDAPMAELLHEGTGILIFSIVLAMMVVLFFFNGNINFYKKNSKLKLATYIWLLQNAFLVVSVCLRDYYYIANYGLAYKRIGVLFFLVLVLAGLVSVFIKIRYQKSNYFLFRFNSNIALLMLVVGSIQNWDVMIANYNIARMDKIKPDIQFLMSLSDQTIPIMRRNLTLLEKKMNEPGFNGWPGYRDEHFSLSRTLAEREARFLNEQKSLGWLSWNLADEKLLHSFSKPKSAENIISAVR